jgi:hypothetical protein
VRPKGEKDFSRPLGGADDLFGGAANLCNYSLIFRLTLAMDVAARKLRREA